MTEIKKIEIYSVFELPKHGVFIVGMNAEFDTLSPNEIRNLIGKKIVVSSFQGDEKVLVDIGVDISISMQSKKSSINICVGHSVNSTDLVKGWTVYSVSRNDNQFS